MSAAASTTTSSSSSLSSSPTSSSLTSTTSSSSGSDEHEHREIEMDRVVTEVVSPPMWPLTKDKLFDSKTGKPKLDVLKEHLQREGRLEVEAAKLLIAQASALFKQEPNLLELKYPITVCGDVHGQFFDLLRLFEVGGDPKDTQFLFLGDYVDRGCFSTEVVFYLYAFKINFPKSFFMLRGNHECRQLTSFFNFKDECAYKYNGEMYEDIMGSFDCLPLAALINKAFFCVHGGLSPDVTSLDEIKTMERFVEIPREGPMCDLLWSDPYEEDAGGSGSMNPDADSPGGGGGSSSKHQQEATQWFGYNDTRQCSYVYGIEAVKQFLKDNKLTSLIRAHEAQIDGYKMQMINKASGIPRVITIFSAPNYCDVYKNKAACLKFDNNVLNIKQFVDSVHPYYLPNFMDVFAWSLPFVAEKVTDMLANVLNVGDDKESDEDDAGVVQQRGGLLKKKVVAVSKILRMYRILRVEHEAVLQLKQLSPSHKMPAGLLTMGSDAIQAALQNFDTARAADMENEKRPTPPGSPKVMGGAVRVGFKPTKFKIQSSPSDAAPGVVSFTTNITPATPNPMQASASSSSSSSASSKK